MIICAVREHYFIVVLFDGAVPEHNFIVVLFDGAVREHYFIVVLFNCAVREHNFIVVLFNCAVREHNFIVVLFDDSLFNKIRKMSRRMIELKLIFRADALNLRSPKFLLQFEEALRHS